MSILIKGLEMPKKRETITITICDDGIVFEEWKEPGSVFKAIPVPPHGDLIDRDAIKETFCGNCFADEKPMECPEPCMDMRIILDASAIIPADPAEEGE